MTKVLVTGGAGFIGSHTVVELQLAGFEVIIVDNFCNSERFIIDRIESISGVRPEVVEADCTDTQQLLSIFEKNKEIAAVAHFAAHKAVAESISVPLKYYRNNLLSTIALLEAMQTKGINLLVFSSSCTVYGESAPSPVTEAMPMQPTTSPYGRTKQMCEEIITDTSRINSSFRCISLRYFNPIGAHPSGLIGELPLGTPSNLVPFLTQTAAGVRDELKIFGNDYPTPDGTAVRDYIDVVDLAQAHVMAVERLVAKNTTDKVEAFNLGTGKGASVLDVVKTFERVNGVNVKRSFAPRRQGDVPLVYGSSKKANSILGWFAQTELSESLRNAWNWEKKHRGIF